MDDRVVTGRNGGYPLSGYHISGSGIEVVILQACIYNLGKGNK